MSLNPEDLTEIERAGRRCSVCHSGRGWRRLEVVRADGGEPVVLCAACRARVADSAPVAPQPERAPDRTGGANGRERAGRERARKRPAAANGRERTPEPTAASPQKPPAPKPRSTEQPSEPSRDRLKAALENLPSTFSTAMAAKAAGLNNDKTLARLQDLERRGTLRRVGKRWSTEPAPTDLTEALDRLQARTSNLRIVREKARVG